MKPRRHLLSIAAILAPALPACVVRVGGSDPRPYTVFPSEGKVYRVNNRTGEVWMFDGASWRSIGGAKHKEGRKEGRRDEDDDDENL